MSDQQRSEVGQAQPGVLCNNTPFSLQLTNGPISLSVCTGITYDHHLRLPFMIVIMLLKYGPQNVLTEKKLTFMDSEINFVGPMTSKKTARFKLYIFAI